MRAPDTTSQGDQTIAVNTSASDQRGSRAFRVIVSSYACRPNAGSELGTGWNWVVHLAESGCELAVFTAARNREETEAFLASHPMPNVSFHFVAVPWLPAWEHGARHYLLWHWRTWREARRLIRAERFDLSLHVSYGSIHVPTQLWRLGLPTIFGPVGGGQVAPASLLRYFGPERRNEERRTLATRLLPKLPLYRDSMRRMRVVLGANSDTVALARRAGCRDVRLLCDTGLREDYAAAEPRQFHPQAMIRLLWVGSFRPRKGLLLAFDALKTTSAKIELTLVGDGLAPEVVERMLAERELTGRVHWRGTRLSWMEVRESFRTHDALFFTSLRDSFGSQLLEAMSQGLPIVALSMSGARDFLPAEGCLKIEPGLDADETVRRLTAALDDFASLSINQRDRMSAAVWRTAQMFSWKRRAETMMAIFAETCSKQIRA